MSLVLTTEQKIFLAKEFALDVVDIEHYCKCDVDFIAQNTIDLLSDIVDAEDEDGNYDREKANVVEEIMNKALNVVMEQTSQLQSAI